MPITLRTTLPLLIAATVFCYAGTRLVWAGFGGQRSSRALLRGIALSMLLTVMAVWMTVRGSSGSGIAVIMTGSVVMLTLGLGLAAMSRPTNDGLTSTSIRALAPMCAAVCLVGFSGILQIDHALLLAVLGAVLLWMLLPQDEKAAPLQAASLSGGAVVVALGLALMMVAASHMINTPVWPITGPVFVLLVLLSTVGLLAGDAHVATQESAIDTVVGYVIASLGIGLPLIIVLAHVVNHDLVPGLAHVAPIAATSPATMPTSLPTSMATTATAATTQPEVKPIVMPLLSWRIDSVLMTALSVFLIPVGVGRMKVGRAEGTLLVLVSVIYVMVSINVIRFQ